VFVCVPDKRQWCTNMGFLKILKKLRFWRKRNNDALTTCDIATSTDNVTLETCTQVSSIEVILRSDAAAVLVSSVPHFVLLVLKFYSVAYYYYCCYYYYNNDHHINPGCIPRVPAALLFF
jgi:hypothetical protein